MLDISMAVFGVTGLLALVTLLVPLAARANVAFSIVLVIAGIALGLLKDLAAPLHLGGPLGDFLTTLDSFDLSSETFILVFLPALLFETAIAIDIRRLMDDIAPILVLAVVAVLLSTFTVGFALGTVSDVGIIACLLLAAIVSTTDPIAVVAIFRDLGVPHRLSLLVEGESLFNDAAAISLFALFLGMLTGDRHADVIDGTLAFLRGFLGGLVVGYLCGRAVCWGMALVRGQRFAQITVTVAAAYLTFLLGEHYLHVSGVVAVVTTALTTSYYARTRVGAETWASLTDVWQQVGYWASSLIFILATMRVPEMLSGMTQADIGLLAVLVVSALAVRALVLFGLFPALSAIGWAEPVGAPLRAVIVWGGLRGAISLALALAVVENPQVPAEIKSFVSVLCTGFVLVTLFVNAPLLRPLIRLTGLDRLSAGDVAVRAHALAAALSAVRHKVAGAAAGIGIDPALAEEMAERTTERLAAAEARAQAQNVLTDAEKVRSGLAMLAEREESLYMRLYRDGMVSGRITRALLALAARLQDGVKTDGADGYRAAHVATLAFPFKFRLGLHLQRRLGIESVLARQIANRFEVLLLIQGAIGELSGFCRTLPPTIARSEAVEEVEAALAYRRQAVETALAALRLQYADFARSLQARYLERAAVRIEELEYRRLRAEAVIGHEVFNDLMTDLRSRAARLDRRPAIDLELDPASMVARVPPFSDLDGGELGKIVHLLRPLLVVPGERVVRKGDSGEAMFFIASGAVEVMVEPDPIRLGSGEFFGEMSLITGGRRTADVRALGYCSLLVLPAADFKTLMAASPSVQDCIHRIARARGVAMETGG